MKACDIICLPPQIIADPKLPPGAKLVLALMVSKFNGTDEVSFRGEEFSETLGIPYRTVFRHLKSLCDVGFLKRHGIRNRGGYKPVLSGGLPVTPVLQAWETENSLPVNIEKASEELRGARFAMRRAERQISLLKQKCDRRTK